MEVFYISKHDHEIGKDNVRFTRLSKSLRMHLKIGFEEGYTIQKIRLLLKRNDFGLRGHRDIRSIQLEVERDDYCFHANDEVSVSEWARKLDKENVLLYFNNDRRGKFEFALMTEIGRHTLLKCHVLLCLDATHKTTAYGYNLFTLVSQNEYGEGVSVAHLISSDGTEQTITKFLTAFKNRCPSVGVFMTDNDNAEINVIEAVFPGSKHLLCWWHVLKNWKEKLMINLNKPEMNGDDFWNLLLSLLMDPSSVDDFHAKFDEIISKSSDSFAKYLKVVRFPKKEKWAKCYRMHIPMFPVTNTDMLIESFHKL